MFVRIRDAGRSPMAAAFARLPAAARDGGREPPPERRAAVPHACGRLPA